jgi:DNA-binding NarL/FixJ family response regulator
MGADARQAGEGEHQAFPYSLGEDIQTIVGRDGELAAIRSFLDRVPQGPCALVIEGEAGIGKSTLWQRALDWARDRGWTVLAARPVEAETGHSYAALADLVAPIAESIRAGLPEPQRRALDEVLLLEPVPAGTTIDARAVGAAVVGGIRATAAGGPVIVGIDDATWLDSASARVMGSLVRRLSGASVGVVVTDRTGEPGQPPLGLAKALGAGAVERLELAGLSRGALQQLIHRGLGLTFARPILNRLYAASGGNAYVALEIARAMGRLPRPTRLDEPLPVPAAVRALVRERIDGLAPGVRLALLAVAASADPALDDVAAVIGNRDQAELVLASAEKAGLVISEHGRYRTAHPLIASTVYAESDTAQRRMVHQRLAAVATDPEDRARHLARTVVGPDALVAQELELASGEARRRGSPEGAAELLRLSVDMTPPASAELGRRRLLLGTALLEIGSSSAAVAELDLALATLPAGRNRAMAGLQRAIAAWYAAPDREAERYATAALVDAGTDVALAARIQAFLAVFCVEQPKATGHAAAALALVARAGTRVEPAVRALATWQRFLAEVYLGHPPPLELIEQAHALDPVDDPTQAPTVPGIWALAVGRHDEAREFFADLLTRSAITGASTSDADLEARLAEVELWADRWDVALEHVERARVAAIELEQAMPPAASRVLATVAARRGDFGRARSLLRDGLDAGSATSDPLVRAAWLNTATCVEAAAANHVGVDQFAEQAARVLHDIGVAEPLLLDTSADQAEALIALGRRDRVTELLAELDRRNQVLPRAALSAAVARIRALLATDDDEVAQALAETAPALDDAAGWPSFERLRTLLARAALQRRRRDRRGATASLEVALRIADDLEAAPWRERAAAELDRLGRHRRASLELTPTERQVAEVIAAGATNREAAARLFMSPKTVEAHLSRIYGKLGITSRAELGRRMAEMPK